MIPVLTPTHSFSARIPTRAIVIGSHGWPANAVAARATASSNAADELRDAPIGNVDDSSPSQPTSSTPSSASTPSTPLT